MSEKLTLNYLMRRCAAINKEKGWEDGRSFGEDIALVHSELSEALEEYRENSPLADIYYTDSKPEGIPIELADAVIRIFNMCSVRGIDLERALTLKMLYNSTREPRHGGKAL